MPTRCRRDDGTTHPVVDDGPGRFDPVATDARVGVPLGRIGAMTSVAVAVAVTTARTSTRDAGGRGGGRGDGPIASRRRRGATGTGTIGARGRRARVGGRARIGVRVEVGTSASTAAPLAHEMIQGALVRWSVEKPDGPHPPTCVLIHGILGSRRNLQSFAKRLAERFPSWQFLLVDLRNHGESNSGMYKEANAGTENTVQNAARDVLGVLNRLKIYPYTLIGHSYGGKVAMSMVHQFGRALPRPVQVWVLDTVPGDVWCDDVGDHPRDTIRFCTTLSRPIDSRRALVESLTGAGFTIEGAQWMTTNLKADGNGKFDWTFDLDGIAEMYASYEAYDLWPMLETQPAGLSLDFVQAERSAFVWTPEDVDRIRRTGANVHLLKSSAHWVHIDNPLGLLDILEPSFENMERGFGK